MHRTLGRERPGRIVAGVAAVLLLALVAAFLVSLAAVLQGARTDARAPADAILVLGASVWPGERPSPILLSRIEAGVSLYQQGYADRMILSGGLGGNPPTEAQAMQRVAVQLGVPDSALVLEEASHSTLDNIRNSAAIMAENGWDSALLVSDPYHLYRASRMASDAGIKAYPVPVSDSPGWTIPRLRAYYTLREVFAVIGYEISRVWRRVP